MENYKADSKRYDTMLYRRCGESGILLPAISLGLWHNFGSIDNFETGRGIVRKAFDLGITHFDLANNYGPVYGSAEENFGRMLKKDLMPYRDELIISSKAGWDMWPGPYGNFGSKKYLVASLDQSLKRMGLEYVDIFYHHRPDPETPLEETMGALDLIVRQGKALYVGISMYNAEQTAEAIDVLGELGTHCFIHQPNYSMFDRWIEGGLLEELKQQGTGCIVFSPLQQGLLTNKYLHGIPEDSRAAKESGYLQRDSITEDKLEMVRSLNELAKSRNQSLAQMAIAWLLKDPGITSVLMGVSSEKQLLDNLDSLDNLEFSVEEIAKIDGILGKE